MGCEAEFGDVPPTFRVVNPTSGVVPVATSDWEVEQSDFPSEVERSDFPVQKEHTINPGRRRQDREGRIEQRNKRAHFKFRPTDSQGWRCSDMLLTHSIQVQLPLPPHKQVLLC